jgi:parallel beta-helix repeat protein
MNQNILKIFLLMIFVGISFSTASAVTNLTACTGGGGISAGDYVLIQNISSSGNCIGIGNSNTNLDCKGYSIIGTGSGIAINVYSSSTNSSVKNCVITNYTNAIKSAGDYNTFDNLTVSTIQEGILLDIGCDYNNVTNNNVFSSTNQGIFVQRATKNLVKNNVVHTILNSGIQLYVQADNNTVINNTAYNCTYGIQVYDSDKNNITDNVFYNNTYGVMTLAGSTGNKIENTRTYNNSNKDYNCTQTQTDGGNNCGSTQSGCGLSIVTCDSTPKVTIESPTAGVHYNTTLLLNLTSIDTTNTKYNWNGTNVTYTIPLSILFPEGTYTLYAYAESMYGIDTESITFKTKTMIPQTEIAVKGADALGFFMDWGLIILLILIVLFTIFGLTTGMLDLNMLITGIFIIIVLYITIAISSMIIISIGGT